MFDPDQAYDELTSLVASWFCKGATNEEVAAALHDFMCKAAVVIGEMVHIPPEERNGD